MSTQKYQAFACAVEKGSLSKAAEELGYTQSGISHMMKSLEEEVGFPLLIRTASGIRPNAEGEMLLPLIRELISSNENLEQSISSIRGAEKGHVRIACFFSVAVSWIPTILREFRRDYPNVDVQVIEGGVDVIEERMVNREADLCIYTGREGRSFDWIPLYRDPLLAVVPPEHPLAGAERYPLELFAQEEFILPKAGFDVDVHQVLEQMRRRPRIKFTSCNDYAIIAMVEAGLGVSILSELILNSFPNGAAVLPMDPGFSRTLGLGVPTGRTISPATRNFMRYIRRYVAELPGSAPFRESFCQDSQESR